MADVSTGVFIDGVELIDVGYNTSNASPWSLANFRSFISGKSRSAVRICTDSIALIRQQYAAERVNANKTVAGRVEQVRQLIEDGTLKTLSANDYLDILDGRPVVARKSILTPELQQKLERTSRLIENRAREDATAKPEHTLNAVQGYCAEQAGLGALLGRGVGGIGMTRYAHPALVASVREYHATWDHRPVESRMDLVTWLKRAKLLEARR